jgi:hypothetical protein
MTMNLAGQGSSGRGELRLGEKAAETVSARLDIGGFAAV